MNALTSIVSRTFSGVGKLKRVQPGERIITRTDVRGFILYVNDEFCEISGFRREELLGQPQNIVRHPLVPKWVFADLWNHLKRGKSWNGVLLNRCKDGSAYWVDANISPIYDGTEITGYLSVRTHATDSQIHRAETLFQKKVKASRNRFAFHFSWSAFFCGLATIFPFVVLGLLQPQESLLIPVLLVANVVLVLLARQFQERESKKKLGNLQEIISSFRNQNLKAEIPVHRDGHSEYNRILHQMQGLNADLRGLVSQLFFNADALGRAGNATQEEIQRIERMSQDLGHSVTTLMTIVSDTFSSAEKFGDELISLTQAILDINNQSSQLSNLIEATNHSVEASSATAKGLGNTVQSLLSSVGSGTERIQAVANQFQKVAGLVTVIQGVAEKTNLLSLNASIEAARAGESGKGFAVVANEIRKLAEQTNHSALEIRDTLSKYKNEIDAVTKDSLSRLQELRKASEGLALLETGFEEISKHSEGEKKAIMSILEGTKNIDKVSQVLCQELETISSRNLQNNACTQELNQMVFEQSEVIASLHQTVDNLIQVTRMSQGVASRYTY